MSAGCGFRKETIVEMRRNGRDAPIPAVRDAAIEPQESTHKSHSFARADLGPRSPEAAIRRPYSITSSARARMDSGTVRPSVLAVLRLMISSNFVGCSTGISAGSAPFKILST
jgi:hypothetical protein